MGERKYCYKCMEKYDADQHVCPHCGYDENTPHDPMYIAPGTILHDRYLVGILLVNNGEGATYVGYDISTGCKVLLREYMPINLCTRVKNKAVISVNYNNLAKYKAFMAEYTELNKSLARLRNNPNINPVLDMFAENNTTYTVFEYIEGVKMLDYLKENAGELSWEQVSKLFPPLFTTIGILHNAGIIHRAISPETVYITDKGELKLSGFCVSAVRTADAGLEHELFKGYAAPEQYSASSSSRQGSWTDVYAVCALIYRALTGCMPVDSLSRMNHDDLLEPSKLDSKIPPHISRVIMDGMNLNGRDRIQTITELVTRLFEQPAPVEKAEPAPAPEAPPSHAAPEPYPAYQQPAYQQEPQPYQQQYYGAGYNNNYGNYRNNSNDDDSYHYEKVNTVDRIKVPIIIGVLLLAIFLIIAFVIIQILTGGDDGNGTRGSSASVTDNIISENQDSTFADIEQLDTVMPNLVDSFFDETKKTYEDKGLFKLEKISEYSDEYEYGLIMWQSVEEGEMINSTTTVKVKVSIGKKTAVIPEYSGYSVSVYSLRLKEAGIYEDNYSLVEDKKASGEPGNVSSLQYDNKSIKPGDTLDKSEGKKLIVYYVPSDAVQVATTSAAVTTAAPETTTTAAATTEAPVTTTQAVQTQPPETQPPVTQPPETQPIITEPIVTEPPQPITDENGQEYW